MTNQYHQRPESEWEKEFDNFDPSYPDGEINWSMIRAFIEHHVKAAYDQGVKDTNFQMARLLENNKLLTEKIRAWKYAVAYNCGERLHKRILKAVEAALREPQTDEQAAINAIADAMIKEADKSKDV